MVSSQEPIIPGSIQQEEHLVGLSIGDEGSTKLYVSNLDYGLTDGDIERTSSGGQGSKARAGQTQQAEVDAQPAGALPAIARKDLIKRRRNEEESDDQDNVGMKRRILEGPLGLPMSVYRADDGARIDEDEAAGRVRYHVHDGGSIHLVGFIPAVHRMNSMEQLERALESRLSAANIDPQHYTEHIYFSSKSVSWDTVESISPQTPWLQFQREVTGVLVRARVE